MGLKIYYPENIRNALLAAEQAVNATDKATGNKDDPFSTGFLAGYRAALATIAVAFGLVSGLMSNKDNRQPQPAPWVPTPLPLLLRRDQP